LHDFAHGTAREELTSRFHSDSVEFVFSTPSFQRRKEKFGMTTVQQNHLACMDGAATMGCARMMLPFSAGALITFG
jgi:hypothetical protein